jgi:hypothetical protein
MFYAPAQASNEQLQQIVRGWIDLVAKGRYAEAFDRYSYRMAPNRPELTGAECIRSDIESYRSPSLFPAEANFRVTDWREAQGDPPPTRVEWYKPSGLGIACVVSAELPLNGKWSTLTADFLLYELEPGRGHLVELEHLSFFEEDSGGEA